MVYYGTMWLVGNHAAVSIFCRLSKIPLRGGFLVIFWLFSWYYSGNLPFSVPNSLADLSFFWPKSLLRPVYIATFGFFRFSHFRSPPNISPQLAANISPQTRNFAEKILPIHLSPLSHHCYSLQKIVSLSFLRFLPPNWGILV